MNYISDKRNNMNFDKEMDIIQLEESDINYILKYAIENPNEDFYDAFYVSKYSSDTVSVDEKAKEYVEEMKKLEQLSKGRVNSEVQPNSPSYYYTYVNGGRGYDELKYRIYLAPNPENLHNIAGHFAAKAYKQGIGTEFKIQGQGKGEKKGKIDRMIIYCTTKENLEKCLNILDELQKKQPQLFYGSEKSPIWYKSPVENVFIAPEIIQDNQSYGSIFARSVGETIAILKYLYNSNDINEFVRALSTDDKTQFYYNAKLLLRSALLKNSCCMTTDYKRLFKNSQPMYSVRMDGHIYSKSKKRK